MKSDVEKLSPTRVKMTVEVTYDELKPSIDTAYQTIGAQVQVPGFRRGKVPARIIDQRVGRGAVLQEAVNEAMPQFFGQAIEEQQVRAIGQPSVEITQVPIEAEEDLVFVIETDVRPEVELPDLDGVTLEVADAVADEAEIEESLTTLRERFGSLVGVERAVEDGDFVSIDLRASVDGEEIDSVTGVSYEVGSGTMLEGMDEALIGLSAGESKDFTAPLAGGDHAGRDADCTVTVQSVKVRELPEADDEFAQLASEFDTLEELKADLATKAGQSAKYRQGIEARDKLVEHLLEVVEVPVPEGIVEAEVQSHLEGEGRLEDDEHRAEVTESSRRSLKLQFILDAVAEKHDVQAGQEDLIEYLIMQAQQYGMDPNQFAQAVDKQGQIPAIVAEVTRRKALAAVLESVTITDASGNEIDLDELVPGAEDDGVEDDGVEDDGADSGVDDVDASADADSDADDADADAADAAGDAEGTAVFVVFTLAGISFATIASRVPDIRDTFAVSPGELGIILLALSFGAVAGLPVAGTIAARIGQSKTVRLGMAMSGFGLLTVAVAVAVVAPRPLLMLGLFLAGSGVGIWDVAMNIEGAAVERALRTSVMPHFHAAFSAGTVVSALVGALLSSLSVSVAAHFTVAVIGVVTVGWWATRAFLPFIPIKPVVNPVSEPVGTTPDPDAVGGAGAPRIPPAAVRSPWTEPRTLLIGVLVLAAAFTEGTANDWLAVALVDGYGLSNGAGVFGLAVFLTFMTAGRILGTRWLDRYGRVAVLRVLFVIAAVGAGLVVFGTPVLAFVGAALWGLGASLGFPVGMSAAADEEARAPMRISVVATIGYLAFIAGPPLLGFLGEHIGVLRALTVVGALALLALLVLPAVREPEAAEQ